jgi:ribosomal protein S18 acetylase RimI-like enzyme
VLVGGSRMINIKYKECLDEELGKLIDTGFNKYAIKNDVTCNYTPFNFIAKDNNEVVGIITGHSFYKEVHIGDLIVSEQYRNKDIGSKLMKTVEIYYRDKGFENMNLSTYNFQAPEFYKKCGFQVEFMRENKENPKLNKYYFVKYF